MISLKYFLCCTGFFIIAGTASLAAGQANAPSMGSSAHQKPSDTKFVTEAADGGMAEVELGQLAVEKATSDDVKKFGQRMVDDHSKANEKLKAIAANKKIELPQEPSAKHKATKARLAKLSGTKFDHAYMADMVKDHKTDVAMFHRESNGGADPDVKAFATEALPILKDHLKQAQSLAAGK
jgi:putative membrane protein